jgi:hypothetical protein
LIDVTDKTAEEEKEEEKKRIGEQLSFFSVCSIVSLLISLHPSSNFCRTQLGMFFSEFFFSHYSAYFNDLGTVFLQDMF